MDIRRIAAAVTMAAVALVPNLGHAITDKNRAIGGTACTVGDETLTYDTALTGWIVQGTVTCGAVSYANINLSLTLTQIQGVDTLKPGYFTGGTAIAVSSSCTASAGYTGSCSNITVANSTPRPTLAMPGLYILRAQGIVTPATGPQLSATHGSCFLVNDFKATDVLDGCHIS